MEKSLTTHPHRHFYTVSVNRRARLHRQPLKRQLQHDITRWIAALAMSIGHSINMALFLLTAAFAPSAAALPDLLLIGLKTNVGTFFVKKTGQFPSQCQKRHLFQLLAYRHLSIDNENNNNVSLEDLPTLSCFFALHIKQRSGLIWSCICLKSINRILYTIYPFIRQAWTIGLIML
jgi:hypothetical protein